MSEDQTNTVKDLIKYSYEQKPMEFQQAFNDIITDRIAASVENRKMELAQTVFNDPEPEIETDEPAELEVTTDEDSQEETEDDEASE